MQTAGNLHDQARKTILRVSQRILHSSRTLDTRNGMFNPHTDFRYLAVTFFLFGSQFLLARLFFRLKQLADFGLISLKASILV